MMSSSTANPDFNLADGREYMLGRSYSAASRLNLQHYLWKDSLHFNLHPSISIPEVASIADVAAGTAMWLIDVAREHPNARLDGFDIDISQAPPKEWLSPNITLKKWNVFDDVPEHMIGTYDVVHVRLLVLVVQGSDPRSILRNLIRMLKPGGWIQWDELDYPGTHIRTIDKSSPTPALHELREMVYSRGKNDWTLRLPEFFAEESLLDIVACQYQDTPELARANGEQHLLTMEEFASSLAQKDYREEAIKIFNLVKDVGQEVLNAAVLSMPRVICVGRKASGEAKPCQWYKPSIGPRLKPKIRKVYKTWAGYADSELIPHLHRIRNQAWLHASYPCVGEWIFLLPSISSFPEYPEVLARAQAGEKVLDLGCGFGQDLRLLAADGASTQNMYASDISKELWNLGFELFNDRHKMLAKFIQANIFDTDSGLGQLTGKVDIVVANQFIHLFDLEQQVLVLKRIVELSKPGTILIGYQRAQVPPKELERPWGNMYFHDDETYRKLWQRVELETNSTWNVGVKTVDLSAWGMEEEDVDWMPEGRKGINFVVRRRG